jgi:Histidine kinase
MTVRGLLGSQLQDSALPDRLRVGEAIELLGAEWLWIKPDPGWGAWLAGSTLTVLAGLLIGHEISLVAQLRAAQAGLADQARTAERNRIARELHDVLGHTLTVSLLHVQSARLAVEHDPADAARSLAEAERLGRECLAEVRTKRAESLGGSCQAGPGGNGWLVRATLPLDASLRAQSAKAGP